MAKVVRVEEVAAAEGSHASTSCKMSQEQERSGLSPYMSRPQTGESQKLSLVSTGDGTMVAAQDLTAEDSGIEGETEDERSEAGDVIKPLPQNWPAIPQLFRRRSCEMSGSVNPCVKKATAHLELLQTTIEQWFKEVELDLMSRASSPRRLASRISSAASATPSEGKQAKKHLRFKSQASYAATDRFVTSRATSAATSDATLSIHGVGAQADRDERPDIIPQGLEADIPYLGAEEVVDEVLTLLARLDKDRIETEESLKKEKNRVKMLGSKIDQLAEKRRLNLPAAVQAEHIACSEDINELQWHVSYDGRRLDRVKQKVNSAEVLNARLKEDIAFVKKHSPLIQEKLDLESSAMFKIKDAQAETVDELTHTVSRKENVESKSQEAMSKAELERAQIKRDLDKVRGDLNQISEELAETRMTYNRYIHQINDCRQQLIDNEKELVVLEVKNENSQAAEAMQAQKVKQVEAKIREQEYEHKKLDDANYNMKLMKEQNETSNNKTISDLETGVELKEERLKQLVKKNEEREMMIEDMEKKIADCDKQKILDEKNIIRINKEIDRTDSLMTVTMQEFQKVQAINNAVKDTLMSEEEKASAMEEALRATADQLKKQVKDEIHTKTVMQARIQSDSVELVANQGDAKVKKDKVGKHVEELAVVLQEILAKVEKEREEYSRRAKAIEALESEISQVNENHTKEKEHNAKCMGELQPQFKKLKEDELVLEKKMDHINWKSEMMSKKMEEYDRQTAMIMRVWDKTEAAIKKSSEEMEELSIKLEYCQNTEKDLKESLKEVVVRMKHLDVHHEEHMKERTLVNENLQVELQEHLKVNKDLASRYRKLQAEHLNVKDNYMNAYEGRINLETTLKDAKQLHSLQVRMHAALQEYYRYRGAYNDAELKRMVASSTINGAKVDVLRREMDTAVAKISDFLKTHLDGNAARKMAVEALQREEAGLPRQSTSAALDQMAHRKSVVA